MLFWNWQLKRNLLFDGTYKMGSGYGANYADVVTEDFINDILKESGEPTLLQLFYDAFPEGLSESNITFCRDEWSELQISRYETLIDVFNDLTDGLELSIGYHNSSQYGDRYDDVDGIFWSVEGVYQYTEAGERYKDKISRSLYVTYG